MLNNRESLSKDYEFQFNVAENSLSNIIKIKEIPIYESNINHNTYLFGYEFEKNIDSSLKSTFIRQLKNKSDRKISDKEVSIFVSKAIDALDNKINLAKYEFIVYPESRSDFMFEILNRIYDYTAPKFNTIELVKKAADQIEFDFEAFTIYLSQANYSKADKLIIKQNIDRILEEVKSYNYFSIANAVKKPKYRRYFKNFLKFKSKKDEQMFKSLQNTNVLIVDDINTTGSTIKECLRVLNMINHRNTKVIFTLLGKHIELDQ